MGDPLSDTTCMPDTCGRGLAVGRLAILRVVVVLPSVMATWLMAEPVGVISDCFGWVFVIKDAPLTVVTNAIPTTGTPLESETNVIEEGQRLEIVPARLEARVDAVVILALEEPLAALEEFWTG